ncbi:Ech-hydrogenase-related complex, NuoL-like integral membrane lipoprotein subunit [Desulfuromonas sp. DDH964]|uniref:proton-conducting transporter transmembrane domain-containing protein n=1 Tax=Desulfuromonas sp. DDH964 TaxID=1823759 RepID=UPI00078ED6CE|nr:proton-conducting transporter membrane subunit [Desulfuromonas sp. DDH964]AMV73057.1 Ech-hydrogenase-related complex, NuoL-like integral membrane lipoprotein subunit [Desulfuromonas sp. DDH964]
MTCFPAALVLLAAGAFCALLTGRRSDLASLIGTLSSVGGGLLALAAAWPVLAGGRELTWSAPWRVPAGVFALRLDPLAAWFVLPIALLGICCALFGASYLRGEGKSRSLAPHWFHYNLLLAAMLLVATAANAVLFLAAWEIMTLTSFFLVAWDHRHTEARQAAWLYLLAAHCGLMLLLALFLEAGVYCGSFNFAAFTPLGQLPAANAAGFFLLALFGFGVKAGLLPLHIWLPDAHPAAPSHISALMSGVLVKTGIYGLLRILTLLPPAPAWWGWLLAGLGGLGALYGIALACLQQDIKRCLAYSTIENVGIIFLGLGFGLVAQAQGHPAIALLAFAGGMLHIWNHALFKGLMFLGAGALVHATGTRNMNRMGGLLRRMPLTGLLWIGGSLAISALPPLNGLISEWRSTSACCRPACCRPTSSPCRRCS